MVSAERLRRLLDAVVRPPLSTGSWTSVPEHEATHEDVADAVNAAGA